MTCRACYAAVDNIIDLGAVPLANDFDAKAGKHPLRFGICSICGLLQIQDDVPPEQLFCEYPWVAGTSNTMQQYAKSFASFVAANRDEDNPYPFVVEIASNDGTLLEAFVSLGIHAIGIDPSSAADIANERGLRTVRKFFSQVTAGEIVSQHGEADIVVARNVIGHVKDPVDFVFGIEAMLASGGEVYIESPYAGLLRDQLQYDTIFHEHCSYFTITTLAKLLEKVGLRIAFLDWSPMNGGSFIVKAVRGDSSHDASALSVMNFEEITNLNRREGWRSFASLVRRQSWELRNVVACHRPVAAYGAAAKFMTMLAISKISSELVSMVADDNPMKHGKHCPGTDIPVVSCEELLRSKPDHVLIGAWNYETEIMGRLKSRGYEGQFISSLPLPRVL